MIYNTDYISFLSTHDAANKNSNKDDNNNNLIYKFTNIYNLQRKKLNNIGHGLMHWVIKWQ